MYAVRVLSGAAMGVVVYGFHRHFYHRLGLKPFQRDRSKANYHCIHTHLLLLILFHSNDPNIDQSLDFVLEGVTRLGRVVNCFVKCAILWVINPLSVFLILDQRQLNLVVLYEVFENTRNFILFE